MASGTASETLQPTPAGSGVQPIPSPTATPSDIPPSSEWLIAAALEAGAIDYGTSLLYRVYAAFGSAELPAEYRSKVVDLHAATFALKEIGAHEAELTPAILHAVAPYLARPNDPSSIFNPAKPVAALGPIAQAPAWVNKPAAGGKARVWISRSPTADVDLDKYVKQVDQVWPKVFSLTREPLGDEPGEPLLDVNPDSGIDIYFADVGSVDPRILSCRSDPAQDFCAPLRSEGGYTQDAKPFNEQRSSAYVVIDVGVSGDVLTSHIAHELVHTSQNTHDRFEATWLLDATATWGAFRTLQLLGIEPTPMYEYLADFYAEMDDPLTRNVARDVNGDGKPDADLHPYGAWLYFFSLQADYGDQILPPIFAMMSDKTVQDAAAADGAYPFAKNFGRFAVNNWNRETAHRYRDHDPTFPGNYQPQLDYHATLHPGDDRIEFVTGYLSADYANYDFSDDVRQVIFDNNFGASVEACKCIPSVWLIAKASGVWREPEEITGRKEYCFARPAQDLDELIVVVANTGWQAGPALTPEMMPTIEALAEDCELAAAEGTIIWTRTVHTTGAQYEISTWEEDRRDQITFNVRLRSTGSGYRNDGTTVRWEGTSVKTSTDYNGCVHTERTTTSGDEIAVDDEGAVGVALYIEEGAPGGARATLTGQAVAEQKVELDVCGGYHEELTNEVNQSPMCEIDDFAGLQGVPSEPSPDGVTFVFNCSDTAVTGGDYDGGNEHTTVTIEAHGTITLNEEPTGDN